MILYNVFLYLVTSNILSVKQKKVVDSRKYVYRCKVDTECTEK